MKAKNISIAALSLVAVLGFGYLLKARSKDPLRFAERYHDCLFSGDGDCLSEFVLKSDLEENNLSATKLLDFVKQNIRPKFSGYTFGKYEIVGTSNYGFTARTTYSDGTSKNLPFETSVSESDEGLIIAEAIPHLVSLHLHLQRDNKKRIGLANARYSLELFKENKELLEKSGIIGMRRSAGEPFLKWSDSYIAREKRIIEAEKLAKGTDQTPESDRNLDPET